MSARIALVKDGNTIYDEKTLCALLAKTRYIAISGTWQRALFDKCSMGAYRGSGFSLPGFAVPICIFETEVGPGAESWTVVGPGSNFAPKYATLKELENQILDELGKIQPMDDREQARRVPVIVHTPVAKMSTRIALVKDGNTIHDATTLCELLAKNRYIAISGTWHKALFKKCKMGAYRGSGFSLPGFEVPICIFETEVGPGATSWTVVGPGSNFEPKHATLEELERQIIYELENEKTMDKSDEPIMGIDPEQAQRVPAMTGANNKDNDLAVAGTHEYTGTWYCGKFKGPTSFIPFNTRYKCPPDQTCGPEDGIQCIACKWAQDVDSIGPIDQTNCHTNFGKMFANEARMADLFSGIRSTFKVCNGRLNENQGTKAIFLTALEMLEENQEDGKYYIKKIKDMKISIDSAECVVNVGSQGKPGSSVGGHKVTRSASMSNNDALGFVPGDARLVYKVYISCKSVKKEAKKKSSDFCGYRGVYTECTIQVRA